MKDPLFNWLDHRAAGVLLHPTSLPGEYGIGTLNEHAYRFIDFLTAGGFKYWQLCPLGPTGFGDSPYQSFSSFAGNPYLISLNALEGLHLLDSAILEELKILPNSFVDYGGLFNAKWPVLDAVYEAFVQGNKKIRPYGPFASFKKKHADWLEPYAYFQAFKAHFDGKPWYQWPKEFRSFSEAKDSPLLKELERKIDAEMFFQYLFEGQWQALKSYSNKKGVEIIGDIPIFVALDSADVWQNPQYFQLDPETYLPTAVAGCPPDYFSEDGQLWGNPLYDWDALAKYGNSWWIKRLKRCFQLYDVVRVDHFRGFDSYWSIPYGSETARFGEWKKGPGLDFFKSIKKKIKDCKLIAEDLGDLTDDVRALRRDSGLPGMSILQFAFGGDGDNFYLPHNLQADSVLYPGTHDNNTSLGWFESASDRERTHVQRYLGVDGNVIGWDLIRASYKAVSKLAIIPMQDIMSLGSEARFNTPGRAQGNWSWRYTPGQLAQLQGGTTSYLKELSDLYYRDGSPAVV
ncbi:4-alpha-glucanotransferase [Pelagicoccus albus]|uniref:4-alpha-glucanotransferase n=1 Tax=Pelagicoccus albus TaxID=415222 RepID=A0A7X1E9V6_9BACT|nr:4-alpha-glucanotransferase [Pelagicoccus albus]MBC2607593.1 4-alpha-glucanotransferase [Pelagicoccus albus]